VARCSSIRPSLVIVALLFVLVGTLCMRFRQSLVALLLPAVVLCASAAVAAAAVGNITVFPTGATGMVNSVNNVEAGSEGISGSSIQDNREIRAHRRSGR
jgi:hypothetical protein